MMHFHIAIATFIIIITLFQIQTCFSQNQQYLDCGNLFTCGTISIGYPFSGGQRPSYCGYPGLNLTCKDDGATALLAFPPLTYQVLAANNISHTLTVARNDLITNPCPPVDNLFNDTFSTNIFNYSPNDQNITLSYGCTSLPGQLPNQFPCTNQKTGLATNNYYSTIAAAPGSFNLSLITCNSTIVTRVSQGLEITTVGLLETAIGKGFGVQYDANNTECDDCVRAGGRCGHDSSSNRFACFCSDQPYELTCKIANQTAQTGGSKKSSTARNITLPIVGAVIAGVGLGWLIFSCRQRRKKLAADKSNNLLSSIDKKELPGTPLTNTDPSTPRADSSKKSIRSHSSFKTEIGIDSSYFGAKIFSYSELELATDNFAQSRELGDGGFGAVYYGILPDGSVIAVKRLYENNFKRVEQFMNEVQILSRLRHTNLVTLYGCTSKRSRELLLVYEYVPNGTIADHLHGKRANSGLLSWPIRLNIAVETADALAYLHASDIIHRDVKSNNILLDNDFHVKVADFGLVRLFPNDATHVSTAPQGTPGYVDPEYYQVYQLTGKSDVYSFGVVLMELISSLPAVDTNRHRHDINLATMAMNKIQNHTLHELVDSSLQFEENESIRRMITKVAELAFRCLQQERDMRPSMKEVLDTLRGIQNGDVNAEKAEVVDIIIDDGGLPTLPPSPISVTDKWVSGSTKNSSG